MINYRVARYSALLGVNVDHGFGTFWKINFISAILKNQLYYFWNWDFSPISTFKNANFLGDARDHYYIYHRFGDWDLSPISTFKNANFLNKTFNFYSLSSALLVVFFEKPLAAVRQNGSITFDTIMRGCMMHHEGCMMHGSHVALAMNVEKYKKTFPSTQ